jgi:hypothetical protein
MARTRSDVLGPDARPVAVADDVDSQGLVKASGVVELPFHVRWSEPTMRYELQDRADRIRVYEQVFREGTEEDVKFFVDVDQLFELWDDLVLPPSVRRTWAKWFRVHRSVDLGC